MAKGAKIIVDCLIEQGVDTVFGYPGGYVLDIFDELYKAKDQIKQVLTCHEQGASHAADGYARATGKVGVVLATSGPGATNLVTGIATAYMDSVPLVAITGNVALSFLGRDSFQEIDIAGVTIPITKHNFIVKSIDDLADTIREAFRIAVTGRPGPVLVDIPKDVQQADFTYDYKAPYRYVPKAVPENKYEAAIEAIKKAQKPILYVGGGVICANAAKELKAFAEKLDIPVACSIMGLSAFPNSHPLFRGMIGMHGHAGVAFSMAECDLIIAAGARFSDRVAGDRKNFAKQASILHLDIDKAEIGKNVKAHSSVQGDLKVLLSDLTKMLPKADNKAWVARTAELVATKTVADSQQKLNPKQILRTLNKLVKPDHIIATDVGQHQMWTVQTYRFEQPRTLVTSGGLGTMGFGMGAAIGASMGTGRPATLITGDGSFHMNFNEIGTAVKHNLPITVLIFNNNVLGMVRQWQTLFYGKRYSSTTLDRPTDYVKLAEALGAKGMILDKNEDIEKTLKAALKLGSPVVIDCRIFSDENVLPMIPAGKSAAEMITKIGE